MAEGFKPTPAQLDAMRAHGGQITVSAAAGSGKTRVLVQRVIKFLTEDMIPADKLLILTFTNTAAAEMKTRISKAIDHLIADDPGNDFYRRQQLLLGCADICTIDSYCSRVVRENFFRLGISRDYRVGSDTELHELRRRIMSDIIEQFYRSGRDDDPEQQKLHEDFETLSLLLTDSKLDSDLETNLLLAYDKYCAHAFPDQWMDKCVSRYLPDQDINENECAKYLMHRLRNYFEKLRSTFENAQQYRAHIEEQYSLTKKKSYGAVLDAFDSYEYFLTGLEELYSEQELDISAAASIINDFSKVRISTGASKDMELKTAASLLGKFADIVENDIREYALFSDEMMKRGNEKTLPVIRCLKRVLEEFDTNFFRAKTEKGILDFSDLERLMLRMLYEKDEKSGEYVRTEFACELSKQYEQIMIDEYQDTNDIQESIFKAISRDEKNLFVVGDVKQSIYRFRNAEPGLFKARCEKGKLYDRDNPEFPALIVLDRNFRSRRGIIDGANYVFGLIMSEKSGQIEYDNTQRLAAGADYPEKSSSEPDTEIHYIEYKKAPSSDSDDESIDNLNIAEGIYCARLIKKMISEGMTVYDNGKTRPAGYGDFCILLRAVRNKAHIYSQQLEKAGIPSCTDTEYDLLDKYEIRAAVSYLRILSNPLSDVDMAAALMCPVFGFTPDELAELKEQKGRRYYKKLMGKSKDDDALGRKCLDFISLMRYFRTLAVTCPCDRLIELVFEKTGFVSAVSAMKDPQQRIGNLRRFIRFAADYENSTSGGLNGFVRHIRYLTETGSGINVRDSVPANAVRIMTIHHSKGLEFPICILAGSRTNKKSYFEKINFHPELGIGMRALEGENMLDYNTLQYTAIHAANEEEEKSEQMRVLYVAMTRAKEKLVVLSTFSSKSEYDENEEEEEICMEFRKYLYGIAEKCTLDERGRFTPYEIMSCQNYSDWLTMCLLVNGKQKRIREYIANETDTDAESLPVIENAPDIGFVYYKLKAEKADESELKESVQPSPEMLRQLEDIYDEESEIISARIPSKVSASMLAHRGIAPEYLAASRPAFARRGRVSPTERGTATHEFLQFADLKRLYELGADGSLEEEKQRIIDSGMMSAEQTELVIDKNISSFIRTPLFERMVNSLRLYREYRFTVRIPAALALANDKELRDKLKESGEEYSPVMQGAIDCIFEEDDGMVIVDYKTDAVKEAQELNRRYALQLRLYKEAAEMLFDKPVKQCYLYSLHCGEAVLAE